MPQCSEVPIALYTRGYVLSASYIFPYLSPCEPRSSRTRDVAVVGAYRTDELALTRPERRARRARGPDGHRSCVLAVSPLA